MKRKTDLKTIIAVVLGVLLIGVLGVGILMKLTDKSEIERLNAVIDDNNWQIDVLNQQINELSDTTLVYRVKRDVKSGTQCTSDMLESVEVPTSMADDYSVTGEELIGKYFLIDLAKSTVVTKDMVYNTVLNADDRYLDVICDRQPVGFERGDTVDIRVSCPDGQDYLLLEGKLVNDVYGNVINILVSEKDIIIYKGMESDWCRFYKGADVGTAMMVYCVQHVQGGLQSATQYYPIATTLPDGETFEGSVLWTALNDYNLKESDLADWMTVDRKSFEKSLEMYDQYRSVTNTYVVRLALESNFFSGIKSMSELSFQQKILLDNLALENQNEQIRQIITESNVILGAGEYAQVFSVKEDTTVENVVRAAYGSKVSVVGRTLYSEEVKSDMVQGANSVAKARTYRDDIYRAAVNAYNERQEAMYRAKAEALANGIEFNEDDWLTYQYMNQVYDEKLEHESETQYEDGQAFY